MGLPHTPALTTDCAIFDANGRVLLIRRGHDPFKGAYALPGGFVDIGETVEEACRREMREEVGIDVTDLRLVGVYSDPKRDPRGHTVSAAFMAKPAAGAMPQAGDDAASAEWVADWREITLAFDHAKILEDAKRLRETEPQTWQARRGRMDALSNRREDSLERLRMNDKPGAQDFAGEVGDPSTVAPARTKIGVLLVNLGTPDGTTYWPMRRYLKEFLSDSRVIETNRVLWWLILNGIVLTKRPLASGAKYRTVWNEELNESPLRTTTRAQAEKVAAAFASRPDIVVDWAMRYGNPSIASRIDALAAEGCDRLLVFPLYPQYSASTTATVNDKVFDALKAMRVQPAVRTVPPYPDDPLYVEALADSIRAHLAELPWEPEAILASFHGVPQSYVDKGDPYQQQCIRTTEALRTALGPLGAKLKLTFQSRFGRAEWLKPYTDKTVEALARDGVTRIAIITPGFVADCLETLEEIAEENKEIFITNGGDDFSYIPCLNDSDASIRLLTHLIERELKGWT